MSSFTVFASNTGQTWGTFKVFFNTIFYGAALAPHDEAAVTASFSDRTDRYETTLTSR